MRRVCWAVVAGLMVVVAGCDSGKPKLAPVSGQVKVDGKPYPNAYVMFQPNGKGDPGRGSMGITDGEGRFTLTYDGGESGAVVGEHLVRITTMQEADDPQRFAKYQDSGTPDGEDAPKAERGLRPEIIPKEWNTDSQKKFVVPEGGSKEANFDIVGVKLPKKKGK